MINTHHHFYQTLTRAWTLVVSAELFRWLKGLYGVWAGLTPRDLELATTAALAELLLTGLHHRGRPPLPVPERTGGGRHS